MNENEQRDELARAIMMIAVQPDLLDYRGDYSSGAVCLGDAQRIADKVLAAGYSKPRTITTVEELDALGETANIWGSSHEHPGTPGSGAPYTKLSDGEWWDYQNEYSVGSNDIMLPATILHEPTTEATR